MKYWQRKGKWMKALSYVAMVGVFACLYFGMAYFSIILLMFSFHLGNESELCKLRSVLIQVINNQNTMMGVPVEKTTKP